jgi:tetratricopeptide (TPR) repeat protein
MVAGMTSSSSAVAPKRVEESTISVSAKLFPSPERQTLLLCLLLGAVVLVSYTAITHNGFLNYDDDRYITDNPHVRAGLTWATVKWAFTSYDEGNWIPLSWLSHALDCQLFGMNPAGHHYVSVLIHAVNAVLLFLLLQGVTGFRWRSLMVAALFALHPMSVESVAWAAERKSVLSVLLFLLALHAYVWYTRKPGLARYTAVFLAFALGLLSKSQIITFPFLLLLLDYWPLQRILAPASSDQRMQKGTPPVFSARYLLLEKVPLLLLCMASAKVTMAAEKAGGAVQSFARYGMPLRLETAVIAYARYFGKALWPSNLVALYPHPTKLYPNWQVIGAALGLTLVTALVLHARRQRYLVVGWFWFLGSLVPMIGLVQVGPQAMADRFAYLPYIGLFVMMIWVAADWAEARKVAIRWLAIPAVCWVFVLSALTYRQVEYWRDVQSFWQRTLTLTQDNYIAENNLGSFLFSLARIEEAAAHFRAALAIRPDNLLANLNLAAIEDSRGNLPSAIQSYRTVILRTNDVDVRALAYSSLGFDYRELGQAEQAKQCFESAVQLAPHRTRAIVGLGLLAQDQGDQSEAIRQYSRAAAVHPTDVTYLLLAQALQKAGRPDEAKVASARIENLAAARTVADSFLVTH